MIGLSAVECRLIFVIRELLEDGVQLVKLRADLFKDRISRSARDQFRRGWRAGYELDERMSGMDFATPPSSTGMIHTRK